jgi:hypothetical protein
MLSGNVCFLRRACEIIAKQNSSNGNSTDAVRMLLAVEILVNPSSISLPAVSSMLAAKKFLSSHAGSASSRSSNNQNAVESSVSNNTEIDTIQNTDSSSISQEKAAEAKTSGRAKRGRDEVESNEEDDNETEDKSQSGETGDKKRLRKDDVSKPFVVDSSLSAAFGKSNNHTTPKESENGKEEDDNDDDDDSLPDIDIDANPEK